MSGDASHRWRFLATEEFQGMTSVTPEQARIVSALAAKSSSHFIYQRHSLLKTLRG
jgi:hypothetical protein